MRPLHAFLLGLLVFLPATLRRDLWSPDEPRHAEVARTMLVEGEWLVPHLEGRPYPDKPAPPFWLMAASMRLAGGVRDWAARLPFVLAAAGTLALLALLARELGLSATASLLSILILLTSYRFLWLAQRVSLDVLLTFFTTASILALARQVRGVGSDGGNGVLFFGAAALGVLTKGPLGLLVPLFAALCFGLATRSLGRIFRPRFLLGATLFALLVAAWVVPACRAGGPDYTHELLFKQSAGRVLHAWNHRRPLHYYLLKLPLEFLPWTPLLLVALWDAWKRKQPDDRSLRVFLLAWFLPTFVFLSLVQSKRGNYLLPLYPGLAMLSALALERARAGRATAAGRALLATLGIVLVAGVGVLVAPFVPPVRAFGLTGLLPAAPLLGLLLLAGAASALVAARSDRLLAAVRRAASSVAVFVPLSGLFVLPAIDAVKSPRPLAELLRAEAPPGTSFVPFLDVRTEEYRFYSGLDCREVDGRSDFLESLRDPTVRLAVLDGGKYEKLRQRLPDGTKVLANRVVGGEDRVVVIALPSSDAAAGADDGG